MSPSLSEPAGLRLYPTPYPGLPEGLSFNAGSRRVSGTPTTAQTYTVTYTVTGSNLLSDSETFTWTIIAPDPLPSAPDIADRENFTGDSVDWLVPAGTGLDPPFSYVMTGLPAGLSFSTGTRRVTGSPTTVQTETVTYTVTDSDGDTDDATFVWSIADPPDRTPVFGAYADRTNVVNTEIADVTLPAATNGDPPLTYSIAGLPAGLSFDTGTRVVSGTPTADAINTVTLTARDVDGDEADLVFSWTITVSQAPEYGDILVVGAASIIYNRRDGVWSEGASIPSNNAGGVSVNPATGEIAIVNGALYYFGEPGDWSPFTLLRDANNSILTAVNGVAHRSDGSIVIVDLRSERWYERTQDETNFNAGTPIPSNESSPQGIGVDADDNIVIVGTSSDRLYTFSGGSWDSGVPFPSGETISVECR